MKCLKAISLLAFVLAWCFPANSQLINVRTCSAGIQPDGFLDWSKLPAALLGAALNATIPVKGVAGLTVKVQIPVTSGGISPLAHTTNFAVQSPIDLQVAQDVSVTLTFSQPVKSVGASTNTAGRSSRTVTMSANPVTAGPTAAQVSAFDLDFASGTGDLDSYPLQIRSESANINTVLIQFAGASGEYSNYDIVNLRIESGAGPDPANQVPTSGLKQWLRADLAYTVLTPFPIFVNSTWPDQSGNHADASGIFASIPDGPNCLPFMALTGTSRFSGEKRHNGAPLS